MEGVTIVPAKNIEEEKLHYAKAVLQKYDVSLTLCPVQNTDHYFSGSVAERSKDLTQCLQHNKTAFIWMARGGYGAVHLIDHVNFSSLKTAFKWIIGFSDITYFHCYLNHVLDLESIHGTMPLNFRENTEDSIQSVVNILENKKNHYTVSSNPHNRNGSVEAKVVGGNLAILAAVTGSPLQSKTKGKILFIEDVGEHLYKIDRMLYTLKMSGQLESITGLIVGGFTNISDTDPGFGVTLEEIIVRHVPDDIPVCFHFPAGHIDDNRAIVLNRKAQLTVTDEGVTFIQ